MLTTASQVCYFAIFPIDSAKDKPNENRFQRNAHSFSFHLKLHEINANIDTYTRFNHTIHTVCVNYVNK